MDAGGGGQQPPSSSSAFDDFNIDKQEYQSVFKVFDKNNSGEINIGQVFDLITKFEQAAKVSDQASSSATQSSSQGGGGKNPSEPQSTGLRQNTMGGGSMKMTQKQMIPNNNKTNFSPTTKKEGGAGIQNRVGQPSQFPSGGLQLKPTPMETCK